MTFLIRDVVRYRRKELHRIVGIANEQVYLFDLTSPKIIIRIEDFADFSSALERNVIRFEDPSPFNRTHPACATEKQTQRAHDRLALLQPMFVRVPAIFDERTRRAMIAMAAEQSGLCPKTIKSSLHRFWHGGMSLAALMPNFQNCGAPGQPKPRTGPMGRLPIDGLVRAPVLTDEMIAAFERCTNRYYRANRHISLSETFRLIKDQLATRCEIDEETGQPFTYLVDENPVLPTERQFRYWYQKQNRAVSDDKARFGEVRHEMRTRPRLSYAAADNENIGWRFVIDATKLDVHLVSRKDCWQFLGTPTLYIVVDELTGMIVGFSVSLENASWQAAGAALLNCVQDKVDFCAEHGIEIDEAEWPCGGSMPLRILFDRGEGRGHLASDFVRKSGLIIENTAPYRADLKGICEQRFHLINSALRKFVDGARDKTSGERGEPDPRRDAILDLDALTKVLIHCIIYLNGVERPAFRQSNAMIVDGVPPSPIAMWTWCMKRGRIALRRFDPGELAVALLPTISGRITAQGVSCKGVFYTNERLEREGWFDGVNLSAGSTSVELSLHPWLMDTVWLHLQGEDLPVPLHLTPRDSRYSGWSFEEFDVMRRAKRVEAASRDAQQTLAHADLRNSLEVIGAEARAKRIESLRPCNLADAREKRQFERDHRRVEARVELAGKLGEELGNISRADPASRFDHLGDGELRF
ncbi:DDE-type integrase/transposase/recombinase [Croceicoccus mobilis]|uniref:Integrase catalytic domain-containing protein n=1 Tax=Croceicoccus mobilis TaxID=1703339 RepID=A0A916ZAU5_9SPHN|nr:DDE-type integrase/transposase/recombinase [Croceicoccus mobilis]GGD83052.1 hypothetical protein GCM10010990_36420 [Croceicoccus mobilis]